MKTGNKKTSAGRGPKRAYRKPSLLEYGEITKLTQGAAGSGGDGTMMMMCL